MEAAFLKDSISYSRMTKGVGYGCAGGEVELCSEKQTGFSKVNPHPQWFLAPFFHILEWGKLESKRALRIGIKLQQFLVASYPVLLHFRIQAMWKTSHGTLVRLFLTKFPQDR